MALYKSIYLLTNLLTYLLTYLGKSDIYHNKNKYNSRSKTISLICENNT